MPGMPRKFTAFLPRYRKFESISLQRRVSCANLRRYRHGREFLLRPSRGRAAAMIASRSRAHVIAAAQHGVDDERADLNLLPRDGLGGKCSLVHGVARGVGEDMAVSQGQRSRGTRRMNIRHTPDTVAAPF